MLRAAVYVLAVVFVGVCASSLTEGYEQCERSISDRCPAVDPATPVYYPVPENCLQYCECANGVAWLFQCGPDQAFDTTKNICNWITSVDCGSRPMPGN